MWLYGPSAIAACLSTTTSLSARETKPTPSLVSPASATAIPEVATTTSQRTPFRPSTTEGAEESVMIVSTTPQVTSK